MLKVSGEKKSSLHCRLDLLFDKLTRISREGAHEKEPKIYVQFNKLLVTKTY